MSQQYQIKKCLCGAALPVRLDQETVTCQFCNSEYEVVRVHAQRVNGSPQFDVTSLLIGAVGGFIVGGLVFTAFGRELAKSAIKRGARLAGVAEERVEEMIRRGES